MLSSDRRRRPTVSAIRVICGCTSQKAAVPLFGFHAHAIRDQSDEFQPGAYIVTEDHNIYIDGAFYLKSSGGRADRIRFYMPAFCARWPDGGFSIVDVDDETHALIELDQLGDEPTQIWQMQSCLLDFELTENGAFLLKEFGEETGPEIMRKAYPDLNKALTAAAFSEHAMEEQIEPVEYALFLYSGLQSVIVGL
jgi:hypothetical protein